MNSSERIEAIRQRLEQHLAPSRLEIIDDSHLHAGHASAGGGGHYTLHLTSPQFAGKAILQRHRMVYQALADLMPSEVHALSIHADV
ncbi:MAG: BolA family transcriptional regulator [Gammaproteobacteria bacterium]|nr:BolA family transcriptional regulator [Gammaproteobacteria bacterium]